jgi:hypothetical protein
MSENSPLADLEKGSGALELYGALITSLTDELLGCFDQAGIKGILLKSSATRLLYYENPNRRIGWDIDILVPRQALRRAEQVARNIGFSPAEFDLKTKRFNPSPEWRRAAIEETHYELAFLVYRAEVDEYISNPAKEMVSALPIAPAFWFTDDRKIFMDVAVDIHHSLSLDLRGDHVLTDVRPVTIFGRQQLVPAPAWLAFHLIFKIYWEGVHCYGKGLYQFADLCRVIRHFEPTDSHALIELAERYAFVAGMYYVLRRLPSWFGTPLEPRLIEWLESARQVGHYDDPIKRNDFGDVWSKLWGHL